MKGTLKRFESNEAQRLLEALYGQRAELGEIAAELISLLEAAGVSVPTGTNDRSENSLPD
jgi:hypothetical protein